MMKNLSITFLMGFLVICSVQGQIQTFISPLSQNWPVETYTDFEYINRTVSIAPETITLTTDEPSRKTSRSFYYSGIKRRK